MQSFYPYEYMDDWENSMKHCYLKKKEFYSHLNMEDITDVDYAHTKRTCKDFRNICLKIYDLAPAKFLSGPGLAWQAALKRTEVKLDLLTDIDMLLMVEKCISGGIYHSIYRYTKANS